METTPTGNKGRSNLPCELVFTLAPQETDPTPVVTRSSEVSRAEPTSVMVSWSRAWEDLGMSDVSETETRPETDKPA